MPQRPTFDLYEALEVSRTATTQEIRDSYRRLALIHHPDKNRDDAEATQRFQRVGILPYFTFSSFQESNYGMPDLVLIYLWISRSAWLMSIFLMLPFVKHTTIHPFVPKVSLTTIVILTSMYFPTPSDTEPA